MTADPQGSTTGWQLLHLIIAIGALALGFAAVGITSTLVLSLFVGPALLARRGLRWEVLFWSTTLYPVAIVASLYCTWLVAWCALGHCPRPSLDDPKDIGAIFVPYILTYLLSNGVVVALPVSILLTFLRIGRVWKERFDKVGLLGTMLLVPSSRVGSYQTIMLDPLGVLYWFMD